MLESLVYAGVVFVGFSAIMNPLSAIPIFLTLVGNKSEEKSREIAFKSVLTAFVIVFTFALAGQLFLNIFGISFTALRLAGGALVVLIGYEMLQGKQSMVTSPSQEVIEKTKQEETSVAFAPLGTPLLAGPGVIITAMNFATGSFYHFFITILAFGLLCGITYFVFISGKDIKRMLGISRLKVLTKMMGLVLMVIGVQMLIEGFYAVIQEMPNSHYF